MSTHRRLAIRLTILFILAVGVMALAKPQKAFALTCPQQCLQNKIACLRICNGPGGGDPNCIPDCVDSYNVCLAGC